MIDKTQADQTPFMQWVTETMEMVHSAVGAAAIGERDYEFKDVDAIRAKLLTRAFLDGYVDPQKGPAATTGERSFEFTDLDTLRASNAQIEVLGTIRYGEGGTPTVIRWFQEPVRPTGSAIVPVPRALLEGVLERMSRDRQAIDGVEYAGPSAEAIELEAHLLPDVTETEVAALRFAAHALEERGASASANSIRQLTAKFGNCPTTTPEKGKGPVGP
jgi:hypothetical protein